MKRNPWRFVLFAPALLLFAGCLTLRDYGDLPAPSQPVPVRQLEGTWFVQAYLPTSVDRSAFNSTFRIGFLRSGAMSLLYEYNSGEPAGPLKNHNFAVSLKDPETNANWLLSRIWPFETEMRVIHFDPDLQFLLLGNPNRKSLYLIAREPMMRASDYEWTLDLAASLGYDTSFIRRPQQN